MKIKYKKGICFDKKQLSDLFLTDKNWTSGKYPNKLFKSICGNDFVLSAWYGKRMVGFESAIDDGCATVFPTYVIVDKEFQKQGIGSALINKMIKHYKKFNRMMITTETDNIAFYAKFGFARNEDDVSMYIKDWTGEN